MGMELLSDLHTCVVPEAFLLFTNRYASVCSTEVRGHRVRTRLSLSLRVVCSPAVTAWL